MSVHIRIHHALLGGHIHCTVWSSSEAGASAETTHGCNGKLIFREPEFELFRTALLTGSISREVEFVDDTPDPQPA